MGGLILGIVFDLMGLICAFLYYWCCMQVDFFFFFFLVLLQGVGIMVMNEVMAKD